MNRILVVDDNPAMLELTRQRLESAGTYEVFTEARGSRAIETARNCKPDLILLDILMPGMLGSEVAAAVHDDPGLAHIKVIYLTSMVKAGEKQKSGENSVISKSIRSEELLAIIAQVLAGESKEPGSVYPIVGAGETATDSSRP